MTSTNIAKIFDHEDSITLQSICACTNPEHGHTISLDLDEDGYFVTTTISQCLEWADYENRGLPPIKRVFLRMKQALKYVMTGHVQVEGHHLFDKEQAIKDYAEALLGSIDELKNRRNLLTMRKTAGNSPSGTASSTAEDLQG